MRCIVTSDFFDPNIPTRRHQPLVRKLSANGLLQVDRLKPPILLPNLNELLGELGEPEHGGAHSVRLVFQGGAELA